MRKQAKQNSEKSPLVSVVIPVFNEEKTIVEIIKAVKQIPLLVTEIIVVNDGSTDSTTQQLKKVKKYIDLLITHTKNQGKGAAIVSGLHKAKGDIIIIQDADFEYDPNDITQLIQPIERGFADVVYGSRFVGNQPHRAVYFWHKLGNSFLTLLSNIFSNLNLTDMETGYKAFRKEVLKNLELTEKGFGVEPEITAKIAHKGWRIYEVGISYYGRTYEEGKKIAGSDFISAIWIILKWGIILRLGF